MADDQDTQDNSTDNLNMSHDQLMELLNHISDQRAPTSPAASPYQQAKPIQPQTSPQQQSIPANVPQQGKVLDQASGAYIRPETAANLAWTRQIGDQANQQKPQDTQQAGQPQNQWQQIYAAMKQQNPQASPQQLLTSMKAYKDAGAFDIYAKNALGKTVEEQVYASLIKSGVSAEDAAKQVQELRGISPEQVGAKETSKNAADISSLADKKAQEEIGKARGTEEISYAKLQAGMPAIESAVKSLSNLANTANYTVPQQLMADARRQMGLSVGQGAIDSAQYESVLNNVLLPRLRSIFGARVTNFDVQAAAKMLGNPKLSPPEKQAQLQAFIAQATENVKTEGETVKNLGGKPSPEMQEDSSSNTLTDQEQSRLEELRAKYGK